MNIIIIIIIITISIFWRESWLQRRQASLARPSSAASAPPSTFSPFSGLLKLYNCVNNDMMLKIEIEKRNISTLGTALYSSGTPSSGSPACFFLSLLFLCFLSPFLSLPSFSLIPLFLISLPFLFHALCSGCFFVWYAFLIRTCIVFSKLQSQPCCQMLCQEEDQGLRDPNVGLPQEEKDCAQDHVQTQDAYIAGDRRQGRGVWGRAAGNWWF